MDRSQIEKISKALADATRLKIFEAISANNQMNCGEIVSLRGVTPATVSHHLKILSEAELIEVVTATLNEMWAPVSTSPWPSCTRTRRSRASEWAALSAQVPDRVGHVAGHKLLAGAGLGRSCERAKCSS
jgi:predicted transcriptional regulator